MPLAPRWAGQITVILVVTLNPALDVTHHVPGVDWDGVNRPAATRARAGGKGLNVARPAWSLGLPVEAILLLAGHAGRWIVEQLDTIGLPHREAWADGENDAPTPDEVWDRLRELIRDQVV